MTDSLAVSPDLEAFYCYAVVLLAGIIVAYVKMRRFFEGKPGAWGVLSSWGLFAAYAVIPTALFWFLDRTGAVHDTSLFAAMLVGFGYQQVLTGSSPSVRGAEGLGKWWQPFQDWANWTSDRILTRLQTRSARFAEAVIQQIRKDPDSKQLEKLKQLAYTHTADAAALKAQFDALNTPQNQALYGAEGVLENQATLLYRTIRDVRDADYLLHRAGLISGSQYFWYAKGGSSFPPAAALLLLIAAMAAAFVHFQPMLFEGQPGSVYYLWRITKVTATETDRRRSKAHLVDAIAKDPSGSLPLLRSTLKYDDLTGDTADGILAAIIETRWKYKPAATLPESLTESLRTENPDVRARLHVTLLYLAHDAGFCEPDALKEWKPSKSDSSVFIDQQINNWNTLWKSAPQQKPCDQKPIDASAVPAAQP